MKNTHMGMTAKSLLVMALVMAFIAPAFAESGSEKFDQSMQPILKDYLKIHAALSSDSTKGVQAAAKSIAKAASELDAKGVTGEHSAHYKNLPTNIKKAATALSKASDLKKARESFKELSKPMAMWGTMSKPHGIDVVFCSMAKGSWLQKTGTILNPYHGKSMLNCGEVVGGAGHAKKATGHQEHKSH